MKTLELTPAKLLPHQAPMLLIDKVLETDYKNSITVQTHVKDDNIFFQGHFPDYPLLPGVVMIEMMFQTCGILSRVQPLSSSHDNVERPRIGKAVKVKSATFFKEVFPDTILLIKAEKIKTIMHFSEYKALVLDQDGQIICEAELTVTI